MRSGMTASAPSRSSSSTIWLFASGENLTRISPTMPTFGFRRPSCSGSTSKSWMMPRTFRENALIDEDFF